MYHLDRAEVHVSLAQTHNDTWYELKKHKAKLIQRQSINVKEFDQDTLQTNPWHSEEDFECHILLIVTRLQEANWSKATNFLFLIKVIAKLERTLSTT